MLILTVKIQHTINWLVLNTGCRGSRAPSTILWARDRISTLGPSSASCFGKQMDHHSEPSPFALVDWLEEADVLLTQMVVADKLYPPPVKDVSTVALSDVEMGIPLLPSWESKCDCLAFTRKMHSSIALWNDLDTNYKELIRLQTELTCSWFQT